MCRVEGACDLGTEGARVLCVLVDCTGRYANTYDAVVAGAELALLQRGGKLAGNKLTDGVAGRLDRRPAGPDVLRVL